MNSYVGIFELCWCQSQRCQTRFASIYRSIKLSCLMSENRKGHTRGTAGCPSVSPDARGGEAFLSVSVSCELFDGWTPQARGWSSFWNVVGRRN